MGAGVRVIVNPAAGRGRGARALPAIRAAFAAVGIADVRTTDGPGQEGAAARAAIDDGCTTVVAAGGDGTWSNVANAILHSGADCRLALLAAGTGNDFAKTVGAPASDPVATARLVAEGSAHRVDVGCIEEHFFLNIAGFGFDTAVLEDIARVSWLRGNAVYIYSALRQLFGYQGIEIDVGTAARQRGDKRHLMLIIANARNFGGAFRIAPSASLTDGLLDAISIHDASAMGRLRLFAAATKGTHLARPEVIAERAAAFSLRFKVPPAYETDGEYRRARTKELEIRCLPGALRVIAPAGGLAVA